MARAKVFSIYLIVLGIFSFYQAFAQLFPRTVNFTREIYGAHNQNWMIAQSSEGKMYFGNTDGLLQFDGINWEVFPLPHHQAIRSVACDEKGHVFTGSFGDFGYWKYNDSGDFEYYSLIDSSLQERARKEEIWNIVLLDDHVLFQSFSMMFLYDYQSVSVLYPPGNIMYAFPVNGELYVQLIDSGIYRFSPDKPFELVPSTMGLSSTKVMNILPFGENELLIVTDKNGLFLYGDEQLLPWENDAQKAFKDFQLNKAVCLSNGQFAFGTILDGVYILDDKGKIITRVNQKAALQNNTVLALFEDDQNNLWCGLDKGIDLVELNAPLKYFIDKTGVEGTVYSACKFEGNLYLGTNQGVFFKPWDSIHEFSSDETFQIIEGSQGQVWDLKIFDSQLICGHNEGSFLVRGHNLEKISSVTGGFTTIVHPDNPDILLQGTYTGIVVFRKNNMGKWTFSHRIDGFMEPVKSLFVDEQLYFWAANPVKGLHQLTISRDLSRVENIKSFSESDGLPDIFNIDITPFEDQVVFNSGGKHYLFDSKADKFTPLTSYPFDKHKSSVRQFDKHTHFTIERDRVNFNKQSVSRTFNISLVPGNEKIVALDSSAYLFCLDNGFAILDEQQISDGQPGLPTPTLERIEVMGRNKKNIFPNAITKAPVFKANQNNLKFHFFQPVFSRQPELFFQLEGYDDIWYASEGRSFKEFTNLAAGDYIFRIKSASGLSSVFSFSIRQVWYKSPWMLLVYLFVLSGLGIGFYRIHLNRLKKERIIMEEERERALREQEIKSNNEKLSLELVNKSKELANSTMGLIRKNEILQQVKSELVKIRKDNPSQLKGSHYQRILHLIDVHITSDQDWELFETNFNNVHEHFFKKLKTEYPDLTPGDLKIAAYLKMNLSSKEIAPLLNISIRGVENKRYRLRKKIGLPTPENLTEFMIGY